jgi:hypothetical protein
VDSERNQESERVSSNVEDFVALSDFLSLPAPKTSSLLSFSSLSGLSAHGSRVQDKATTGGL